MAADDRSLPEPLRPTDEGRHEPDPDVALWNESWYLDVVTPDGRLGGYIRYSLYPNEGEAWLWACVVGEGRPLVAIVDPTLPLPTDPDSMDAAHGPVSLVQQVAEPFGDVRVRLDAPAAGYDEPGALFDGDAGAPTHLAMDLTWHARSRPYPYPGLTRYELPCTVAGTITVGDEVLEVAGDGERDHSWGHRDWWRFGWVWTSGRLDDGTFVHATRPDLDVDYEPGFVVAPGGGLRPVDRFKPAVELDAEGLPTAMDARLADLSLRMLPRQVTPLRLDAPDGRRSRLVRALCRIEEPGAGGRSGYGWTEWNQPQPPSSG